MTWGIIVDYSEELTACEESLAAALDANADLRDRLDRALCASEAERTAKHSANNRAQKLLASAEHAVAELVKAGANDAAARVQALITQAMGGDR